MMAQTGGMPMSSEMQQCIENCTDSHRICMETITHCLQMGGKHAESGHIRLMLDCAEMCQTSADFMMRGSELYPRTCAVCADICERCAEDCERVDRSDVQMRNCTDFCRRCAESCRLMASARA